MKKVFNNKQLTHIWAQRSQDEGHNPNKSLFFEKDEIYSYGHHYCAAKIYDHDTVLVNSNKYSNTTAKHLRAVYDAITHYSKVFTVPIPLAPNDILNHNYFINKIVDSIDSVLKTTHSRYDVQYMSDIVNQVNEYQKYCKVFNLKVDKEIQKFITQGDSFFDDIKILCDQKRSIVSAKLQAAKDKELEQYKDNRTHSNLHLWLENSGSDLTPRDHEVSKLCESLGYDIVRRDNNMLTTQRGASVPIEAAKSLIKYDDYSKLIGIKIGDFKINQWDEKLRVLKIGCHTINVDQVNSVLNSVKFNYMRSL